MPKIEPFIVGNSYRMVGGGYVRIEGMHNEGTDYETVYCKDMINRYSRRDFGRVTGSPFDCSDPRCLIPLYTLP